MNDRKQHARYWITCQLKTSIECAQKNQKYVASYELDKLRGMLQYMAAVGDIDQATWDKVINLIHLIIRKYHLI